MTLDEIRELLDCEVIWGSELLHLQVPECFAADLMSDVLAFCKSRALLITGLTGVQSIHTTDVADLSAILFVHRKRPAPEVVELAKEKKIPMLSTPHHMFDVCGLLFARGLKGGYKG